MTKREKRAQQFITEKVENMPAEGFLLEVDWRKSSMWGWNPQVDNYNGAPCLDVSGCGYCKLSTAVADMLRHLPDLTTEESSSVWRLGGTGESSVLSELGKRTNNKWEIVRHYSSKTVDVYRVTRAKVGGAVHTHDCDRCRFLGHEKEHDLYLCPGVNPTVIARYGSDGPNYLSQLVEVVQANMSKKGSAGTLLLRRAVELAGVAS